MVFNRPDLSGGVNIGHHPGGLSNNELQGMLYINKRDGLGGWTRFKGNLGAVGNRIAYFFKHFSIVTNKKLVNNIISELDFSSERIETKGKVKKNDVLDVNKIEEVKNYIFERLNEGKKKDTLEEQYEAAKARYEAAVGAAEGEEEPQGQDGGKGKIGEDQGGESSETSSTTTEEETSSSSSSGEEDEAPHGTDKPAEEVPAQSHAPQGGPAAVAVSDQGAEVSKTQEGKVSREDRGSTDTSEEEAPTKEEDRGQPDAGESQADAGSGFAASKEGEKRGLRPEGQRGQAPKAKSWSTPEQEPAQAEQKIPGQGEQKAAGALKDEKADDKAQARRSGSTDTQKPKSRSDGSIPFPPKPKPPAIPPYPKASSQGSIPRFEPPRPSAVPPLPKSSQDSMPPFPPRSFGSTPPHSSYDFSLPPGSEGITPSDLEASERNSSVRREPLAKPENAFIRNELKLRQPYGPEQIKNWNNYNFKNLDAAEISEAYVALLHWRGNFESTVTASFSEQYEALKERIRGMLDEGALKEVFDTNQELAKELEIGDPKLGGLLKTIRKEAKKEKDVLAAKEEEEKKSLKAEGEVKEKPSGKDEEELEVLTPEVYERLKSNKTSDLDHGFKIVDLLSKLDPAERKELWRNSQTAASIRKDLDAYRAEIEDLSPGDEELETIDQLLAESMAEGSAAVREEMVAASSDLAKYLEDNKDIELNAEEMELVDELLKELKEGEEPVPAVPTTLKAEGSVEEKPIGPPSKKEAVKAEGESRTAIDFHVLSAEILLKESFSNDEIENVYQIVSACNAQTESSNVSEELKENLLVGFLRKLDPEQIDMLINDKERAQEIQADLRRFNAVAPSSHKSSIESILKQIDSKYPTAAPASDEDMISLGSSKGEQVDWEAWDASFEGDDEGVSSDEEMDEEMVRSLERGESLLRKEEFSGKLELALLSRSPKLVRDLIPDLARLDDEDPIAVDARRRILEAGIELGKDNWHLIFPSSVKGLTEILTEYSLNRTQMEALITLLNARIAREEKQESLQDILGGLEQTEELKHNREVIASLDHPAEEGVSEAAVEDEWAIPTLAEQFATRDLPVKDLPIETIKELFHQLNASAFPKTRAQNIAELIGQLEDTQRKELLADEEVSKIMKENQENPKFNVIFEKYLREIEGEGLAGEGEKDVSPPSTPTQPEVEEPIAPTAEGTSQMESQTTEEKKDAETREENVSPPSTPSQAEMEKPTASVAEGTSQAVKPLNEFLARVGKNREELANLEEASAGEESVEAAREGFVISIFEEVRQLISSPDIKNLNNKDTVFLYRILDTDFRLQKQVGAEGDKYKRLYFYFMKAINAEQAQAILDEYPRDSMKIKMAIHPDVKKELQPDVEKNKPVAKKGEADAEDLLDLKEKLRKRKSSGLTTPVLPPKRPLQKQSAPPVRTSRVLPPPKQRPDAAESLKQPKKPLIPEEKAGAPTEGSVLPDFMWGSSADKSASREEDPLLKSMNEYDFADFRKGQTPESSSQTTESSTGDLDEEIEDFVDLGKPEETGEGKPTDVKGKGKGEPEVDLDELEKEAAGTFGDIEAHARRTVEKPPYYEDNLKAIIAFPDPDIEGYAQIKSFGGQLGRADGSFRPINALTGTTLDGTVKVIADTVDAASEEFEELRKEADKAKDGEDLVPIRVLGEKLRSNLELLEGVRNINTAYARRYEGQSHAGLEELEALTETIKKTVDQQTEVYKGLVDHMRANIELSGSIMEPSTMGQGNPAESLSAYCAAYCPGISASEAEGYIKRGRDLMGQILTEGAIPAENPEESQEELAALSWFLMNEGLRKQQGYEEGAFMIEDPEMRLFDFIEKSPGHQKGERSSSHFVGRSMKDDSYTSWLFTSAKQRGVDVVNGKLPAQKRTILFARVDNPSFARDLQRHLLFVKLENFSPFKTTGAGYDFTMHGKEFGAAQFNKLFYPGSDDLPTMRKERVPVETIKTFDEIVIYVKANPEKFEGLDFSSELLNLDAAKKNAKLWGIEYMHRFVETVKGKDASEDFTRMVGNFNATLEGLDYVERRTGREVYFTEEDLRKASS